MTTTRACIKGRLHQLGPSLEHAPAGYLYLGRTMTMGGWQLKAHPLANPHPVGKPCKTCGGTTHTQPGAVDLYRQHITARPDLLASLPALRDLTLCCWCKPGDPCHVDVVLDLLHDTEQATP